METDNIQLLFRFVMTYATNHDMFLFKTILLLIVAIACASGQMEECQEWTCAATSCVPVGDCNGPNEVVITGGFCNCCQLCATLVGKHGKCGDIAGKFVTCRNPFKCIGGKCRGK
ncbi:PREDICTED: uncharacterized protein LOC108566521 isoform X2 [Nicrophorus vespilloides]|uniref:Uncharacterized protein LOC108566521 isoform X2 n=1 Tax=Nicrophorus vespilloides TaxID=110193 RepID=A0ABM1N528_NICVS|nr:PREDICTED: uncharacterized protein LOC108566521 isoform X2 [Nicrophorus vespilloides]